MKDFKFISSNIKDAYFNIASEEYLLKHTDGFYIYLWQNSPAVIVGNNQNTLLEVNLGYAEKYDIKVVRRLTGGGAVYHDLNNVCYTIIAPYSQGVDYYAKWTTPVIEFLNSLGVKAEFSGRNDICIDGKKISGNAQVVYKNRIMHHGTLLFDTDLSVLQNVLVENKLKIQSKGIKSVRARVTNIKSYLDENLSCSQFFEMLCDYLRKNLTNYQFTQKDVQQINYLVSSKYNTYDWNIGKSPIGKNRLDIKFDCGIVTITFDLVDGRFLNTQIFGDYFSSENVNHFIKRLDGKQFIKEQIESALEGIEQFIPNANSKAIANKFFE